MDIQNTPEHNKEVKEHNGALRRERLYLAVIILLAIAVGYLGYMRVKDGDKFDRLVIENQGDVSEKEEVKLELEELYGDFNSLDTENDSLYGQIEAQKAKIEEYIAQVDRGNYSIYKLKKETTTLRGIMKGYIRSIDSLNQANKALNTELDLTKVNLATVESERDDLDELSKQQQNQISKGSILRATGFTLLGIQVTAGGKQKETKRAKKANTIKACAVINRNDISDAGNKWVYMRVIDPNKKIFPPKKGSGEMPTSVGNLQYSAKRQVDYQNQDLDVCIYWESNGVVLTKGTYIIEFWADGSKIGQEDIYLK